MKILKDKKTWTIAGLVVLLVMSSISLHLVRNIESRVYIRAFNSVGTIPTSYWLNLQSVPNELSFIGSEKDRILFGAAADLKPDFWTFIQRDKVSEETRCGVKVMRLVSVDVKSVMITDQISYAFFAGNRDDVAADFLESLCKNRSR